MKSQFTSTLGYFQVIPSLNYLYFKIQSVLFFLLAKAKIFSVVVLRSKFLTKDRGKRTALIDVVVEK